jgi:hypothetical protein
MTSNTNRIIATFSACVGDVQLAIQSYAKSHGAVQVELVEDPGERARILNDEVQGLVPIRCYLIGPEPHVVGVVARLASEFGGGLLALGDFNEQAFATQLTLRTFQAMDDRQAPVARASIACDKSVGNPLSRFTHKVMKALRQRCE